MEGSRDKHLSSGGLHLHTELIDERQYLLWQIRWQIYFYRWSRVWWMMYYGYPDPPVLEDGTPVEWHSDRP